VLRTACVEAANWPDDLRIAINVSPIQFKAGNFLSVIVNAIATAGLSAKRLEIEITEALLLHDDEQTMTILNQLRRIGVRIAMDDFGTGYSSLAYLQRFPIDKIKIDRCFTKEVAQNDDSLALVQAVIGIANSRKIATTAEGVETDEQLNALRELGCTEMQGHLFSPALSAPDLLRLLSAHRPKIVRAA
jgi:EAL domain-containing protein (putative c-di-GMP-specific phosphodiesterase class I)